MRVSSFEVRAHQTIEAATHPNGEHNYTTRRRIKMSATLEEQTSR